MSAPPSDDGMSSISPDEVLARQLALDRDAQEFLNAWATGVIVDGAELYSDGTYRPTSVPLQLGAEIYSAQPSVTGAERSGESTPRRRRNEIEDAEPTRSVSPRLLPLPPQITATELPTPLPTPQIIATELPQPSMQQTFIDTTAVERTLAAGAAMHGSADGSAERDCTVPSTGACSRNVCE